MTKSQILNFNFCDIRVGDLFYDWYLRIEERATINPRDADCQKAFIKFLEGVSFWENYFRNHKIEEVLVTHSVYEQGIPARIGLKYNSKVFLVTSDRLFRLNKIDYLSEVEFRYYDPNRSDFNGYQLDLSRSRLKLESLFQGKLGVDVAHSVVSGLSGENKERIILSDSKLNVLIAAHCFSDSPHINGDHLFPDFWEWLCFLANFSLETNYHWYIKAHPAFFESDKRIFMNFCELFPNIKPISSEFSNIELINQGIDVVLTVYGTIAFEAAYLGAIVIDASENTPHMNYNFSLKPKSVNEYRDVLRDLNDTVKSKPTLKQSDILHFYDIHHLRKSENWLFGSHYSQMLLLMGDVASQYSDPRIYDFWIDLCVNTSYADELISRIQQFRISERYAY